MHRRLLSAGVITLGAVLAFVALYLHSLWLVAFAVALTVLVLYDLISNPSGPSGRVKRPRPVRRSRDTVIIVLAVLASVIVAGAVIVLAVSASSNHVQPSVGPGTNRAPTSSMILAPAGSSLHYAPSGTILAANRISSAVYGMVYSGIWFNLTASARLNGTWISSTPTAAVAVPAAYEYNISVLGKILSVAKPAVMGSIDIYMGTASGVTVPFVLMFFPLAGQNGTVTFTTPLVLYEYAPQNNTAGGLISGSVK